MAQVTNEEFSAFTQAFEGCKRVMGGGKVGIDAEALREAVRAHRDAAARFVEIHCFMAASQPGLLQPAMVVAAAIQVEFDDETMMKLVAERSNAVGGTQHLQDIGVRSQTVQSQIDLKGEPPQREAAREWWRENQRNEALCDDCRTPIIRGDGYIVNGRQMIVEGKKFPLGEELLCRPCFASTQRGNPA